MAFDVPASWSRLGLILARQDIAAGGGHVVGDPCIVWDEGLPGGGAWRMFLFADPPGHGQAVSRSGHEVGPGDWTYQGPLRFTNPEALTDGTTHKPYIVQDPYQPNHAARIDGRYCLVSVGHTAGWKHKYIHQAFSERLAGPWTWNPAPLIPVGGPEEFDGKHTDAVTGYYFAERRQVVYFYMGYPRVGQGRGVSPFGNAQGVAIQDVGELRARKMGEMLAPCQMPGHWASGWIGGLQIFPGRSHRWLALLNASPTAPRPGIQEVWTEEPAPSLGGFAWCDEELPIQNWHFFPEPIERIENIPAEAQAGGESTNLWRHHLLLLPQEGRAIIYYNSGYYGQEQLYAKEASGLG